MQSWAGRGDVAPKVEVTNDHGQAWMSEARWTEKCVQCATIYPAPSSSERRLTLSRTAT
jgi:hypothetical protein